MSATTETHEQIHVTYQGGHCYTAPHLLAAMAYIRGGMAVGNAFEDYDIQSRSVTTTATDWRPVVGWRSAVLS